MVSGVLREPVINGNLIGILEKSVSFLVDTGMKRTLNATENTYK